MPGTIIPGMSLLDELSFDHAEPVYEAAEDGFASELLTLAFDFRSGSARSYTPDGFLRVAVCNISKSTVNPYYGREIPGCQALGLDPDKVYKLYRDPSELAKGAGTFNGLQLLDDHLPVDSKDPKMDKVAGSIGTNCRFEDPYLKAGLTVWKQPSIDAIIAKKKAQLSCSYRYRADMTPGISPQGIAYDGVMRDIVGNHVALVRAGRAGPDVYVNDSLPIGLEDMSFKFPRVIAVAAAALGLTSAQQTALDTAFDKAKDEDKDERESATDEREAACDSREEAMDAEEEKKDEKKEGEVARGDRKKARDARKTARDKRAADRKAKDKAKDKKVMDTDPVLDPLESSLKGGASSVSNKASDGISAADAAKLAKDAADTAVAAERAYEQSKRDVAPLVGPITAAMDSAEAVYRFALDHVKVDHNGIHASGLPAVVAAEVRARSRKPVTAHDATPSVSIDAIFKPAQ